MLTHRVVESPVGHDAFPGMLINFICGNFALEQRAIGEDLTEVIVEHERRLGSF